jgi:hypothetical protein
MRLYLPKALATLSVTDYSRVQLSLGMVPTKFIFEDKKLARAKKKSKAWLVKYWEALPRSHFTISKS